MIFNRLSLREQGANTTTRIYPFFQSADFLMIFCLILDSMYVEMCCLTNDIHDYVFVSQGKTTIPNVDDGEECTLTDVRTRRSCHLRDYASLTLNLSLSLSLSLSPSFSPLSLPLLFSLYINNTTTTTPPKNILLQLLSFSCLLFLYFDLDRTPLLVGSFVVFAGNTKVGKIQRSRDIYTRNFRWEKFLLRP